MFIYEYIQAYTKEERLEPQDYVDSNHRSTFIIYSVDIIVYWSGLCCIVLLVVLKKYIFAHVR